VFVVFFPWENEIRTHNHDVKGRSSTVKLSPSITGLHPDKNELFETHTTPPG
jgi:hypothetical protein